MKPHWIECWSEALHQDIHFYICSNCFNPYRNPVPYCPYCKKAMDLRIELSKK